MNENIKFADLFENDEIRSSIKVNNDEKFECLNKEECFKALDNINWEEDYNNKVCITRLCKKKK